MKLINVARRRDCIAHMLQPRIRKPSPWQDLAPDSDWNSKRPSFNVNTDKKALHALRLESNFCLIPESDAIGHIEYKLRLAAPNQERFNKLVTQLKWRLIEGGGTALYEIGVLDNGVPVGLPSDELSSSLATLKAMAAEMDAQVEILREIELESSAVYLEDGPCIPSLTLSGSSTPSSSSSSCSTTLGSGSRSRSRSGSADHTASQRDAAPIEAVAVAIAVDSKDPLQPASLNVPNIVFRHSAKRRRPSAHSRMLPAGRRWCVEVLIKVDDCSIRDAPFINFEAFSL